MSTPLLNDDGTASMATLILLSHQAFRRDLGCFEAALEDLAEADEGKLPALRQEWQSFHAALHGHHEVEDTRMFPFMRQGHAELAADIDTLSAQHRLIDPLLERGDQAFGTPFEPNEARAVIGELIALLDAHLALEEAKVLPHLRGAKQFPVPSSEEENALYAEGFAWSSVGIAPAVLDQVDRLLPPMLTAKLPAARADFVARWKRNWGTPLPRPTETSHPAS